jgi:hypothetical protein
MLQELLKDTIIAYAKSLPDSTPLSLYDLDNTQRRVFKKLTLEFAECIPEESEPYIFKSIRRILLDLLDEGFEFVGNY